MVDLQNLNLFGGVVEASRGELLELNRGSEVIGATAFNMVTLDLVELAFSKGYPFANVLATAVNFWGNEVVSPLGRVVTRGYLGQSGLYGGRLVEGRGLV